MLRKGFFYGKRDLFYIFSFSQRVKMYLEKAKELLNREYEIKYAEIREDAFQRAFMDEKIKHSYQVLGAGNFLLKHEEAFCCYKGEAYQLLQATVLLHDIARFEEILLGKRGIFIDHGSYGADMLSRTDDFNNLMVVLPVRHHGHLIEELYADPSYLALADEEQNKLKNVAFLVRDADKLANFYLLIRNFEAMEKLFFPVGDAVAAGKIPSPAVWRDFCAYQAVNKKDVVNYADRALLILAWVFDLYFRSSFVFLQRLKVLELLFDKVSKFFDENSAAICWKVLEKYWTEKAAELRF